MVDVCFSLKGCVTLLCEEAIGRYKREKRMMVVFWRQTLFGLCWDITTEGKGAKYLLDLCI